MLHPHHHPWFKITRVLLITFLLNLAVAVLKLFYGHVTSTLSMISDGYHSLLDSSSNLIGFLVIWIATKPADEHHPYGHKKAEAFGAMAISFLLFMACYEILNQAWIRFQHKLLPEVTIYSFIIMLGTMLINYWVSHYESLKGKELGSQLLSADAAHTKSDFYASMAVLFALIAVKLDFPIIDLLAAFVIVGFIAMAAIKIVMESSGALLDRAQLDETMVHQLVLSVPGIQDCHNIRTRGSKEYIYMDLNIHVDPNLNTLQAHALSHQVIDLIKSKIPTVVDVVVHTEPLGHVD